MFVQLYTSLLFRPLVKVLPVHPRVMAPLVSACTVFVLSGLLHCHQSMAAFHSVDWSTLFFFILQFVLCTVQVAIGYRDTDRKDKRMIEHGWNAVVERGWLGNVENGVTLLGLVVTTRWFWPPYLDGGFIQQLHSLLLV